MTTINTKFAKLKKTAYTLTVSVAISGMVACSSSTEYNAEDELPPGMGIVTEVKEMKQDLFRITNERIVNKRADSRIIAEYMDGMRDTFTLEEARLVDANDTRRSGMNNVLMGGMMGYMMGKSISSPINRASYANDAAFQKSTSSNQVVRQAATVHKARTNKSKSGYGSKKSTRSYGG